MSATSRTHSPESALHEAPRVTSGGRLYGFWHEEPTNGTEARRRYRRLAHRRERLAGKRAVAAEVAEMRRDMELEAAEAAAEWEEYMDDLSDIGYLYSDQGAYDDFHDPYPDEDDSVYADDWDDPPNW